MKHAPIRMWPCPGAVESGMVALLRSLRRGIPVDRDALELAREEIGADSGTLFKGAGQHCALELLYFMADRLEATQQLVGSLEVILLSPSDKSSSGPSFLGLHERCEAGNVFGPRAAVGFGPKTLLCSIDRQIGGGGKDTVSPHVRESARESKGEGACGTALRVLMFAALFHIDNVTTMCAFPEPRGYSFDRQPVGLSLRAALCLRARWGKCGRGPF